MREKKEKAGRRRFLGKYDGLKYGWLQDAKKFILLLFHNVIGFSIVKGGSMEPTLYEGDVVLYTRLNPQYRRGDVISVRIPSGEYYVKRIIAVAGDTVDLREGEVYGPEETRAAEGGIVRYPYTVQEGQIFVMGDNRVSSMDSRSFGAVGTRQIKGKIWFRAGWIYLNRIQDGQ